MSTLSPPKKPEVTHASDLSERERQAMRDLILALADNKRLLGIRYSDWMLGAPTLETGIAASSMAQDEWGHGRLTYALLSDFGEDPKHLEHERSASEYHSMEVLDRPFRSWAEMLAAALLLDTALTVHYGAMLESRYTPVYNRVQKLLDEEAFHFQYASGWVLRLAGQEPVRTEFEDVLSRFLPHALRWLGREDAPAVRTLVDAGLVREGPDALRQRFLGRVGPVLAKAGLADMLEERDGTWCYPGTLDWDGWNDAARRSGGEGPDAETLARVRGDKNRAMRLD